MRIGLSISRKVAPFATVFVPEALAAEGLFARATGRSHLRVPLGRRGIAVRRQPSVRLWACRTWAGGGSPSTWMPKSRKRALIAVCRSRRERCAQMSYRYERSARSAALRPGERGR